MHRHQLIKVLHRQSKISNREFQPWSPMGTPLVYFSDYCRFVNISKSIKLYQTVRVFNQSPAVLRKIIMFWASLTVGKSVKRPIGQLCVSLGHRVLTSYVSSFYQAFLQFYDKPIEYMLKDGHCSNPLIMPG